jgi:hypothetical protein
VHRGPSPTGAAHSALRCAPHRPPCEDTQTPAQARDAHLRTVREDPGAPPLTSGVGRVRLVLDGRPAAERYVVRSLPRLT